MRELIVDDEGRLTLPADYLARHGVRPGDRLLAWTDENRVTLHRVARDAQMVYLEPTTRCNLNCAICVRQTWHDPTGDMDWDTFAAILSQLPAFPDLRRIVLGGYGEPLVHPRLPEMLERASALGVGITLTTNGLLLDEEMARRLLQTRLDRVVISLDTAHEQAYDGARVAGGLEQVLANARRLVRLADARPGLPLDLGLEFVVTRSNQGELPRLRQVAQDLGASFVLVSHLLPHSPAAAAETLYDSDQPLSPPVSWPVSDRGGVVWGRMELPRMKWGARQLCRFVERRALVVGWDGGVSPCYPLLHSYPYYVYGTRKEVSRYVLGRVTETPLADVWTSAEYVRFRARVRAFDFPSCVDCGLERCDIRAANEDCQGDGPSCADCLWAQGLIQCP